MEPPLLRVAIVGDSLLEASGPIAIQDGLNVLYGLNGAGKTRLLRGMRAAARGIRSDVGLALLVSAVREGHVDNTSAWEVRNSLTTLLGRSLARPEDFERHTPGKPSSEEQLDPHRASELIDEYLERLVGDAGEPRDWVLQNRLFLLIPVGTAESPAWKAWAVADPTVEWARREMELLDAAMERFESALGHDEDENEVAFERYSEEVAQHTLFPSEDLEWLKPFSPIGAGYRAADGVGSIIVSGSIDFGVDLVNYDQAVTHATAAFLRESPNRVNPGGKDPGAMPAERRAQKAAAALSTQVTKRLQGALLDGPFAQLSLSTPVARLYSPAFEWMFTRSKDAWRKVPLAELSKAERLWAERAILEAVHDALADPDDFERRSLCLYDEPESALHRAAESHMARALVSRARDQRAVIVAATHSPELLDSPLANVIEVKRMTHRSHVQGLDPISRDALGELGLNPSDLLRLTRVFLLVEGLHDEVLLAHFLGDRLRDARVEVIPIRGGKMLAGTTDSRVLFDFTEAHVVALLDNTRASHVSDVWLRAQEAAAQGEMDAAKRIVTEEIGYADGESQYLTSWLTRALDRGLASRLSPEGLGAADIIEYLPVDRVVPDATSWRGLHEQHREELLNRRGTPKRFKDWLTARWRTSFSSDALRSYADGVPVPKDFERLMKSIEAISADRSS